MSEITDLPGHDAAGPQVWNRAPTIGTRAGNKLTPRRHARKGSYRMPTLRAVLKARCSNPAGAAAKQAVKASIKAHRLPLRAANVRTLISPNKSAPWLLYGKYIERNVACLERCSFNAQQEEVSAEQALHRWQKAGDAVVYKLAVCPAPNRDDGIDLRAFTRELMASVANDLMTEIDWVAAVHVNTKAEHVHIALRGVDQHGKELSSMRSYLQGMMYLRVREAATTQSCYREIPAKTFERKRPAREITRQIVREHEPERGRSR